MTSQMVHLQAVVTDYYQLDRDSLRSRARRSRTAQARHMAMYLGRVLFDMSYPELGEAFRRDHTTVILAVRKMASLIKSDEYIRADMESIRQRIASEEPVVGKFQLSEIERRAIVDEVVALVLGKFRSAA